MCAFTKVKILLLRSTPYNSPPKKKEDVPVLQQLNQIWWK